jgi:hypothetical protein
MYGVSCQRTRSAMSATAQQTIPPDAAALIRCADGLAFVFM